MLLDSSRVLPPVNQTIARCLSRQPLLKLADWEALPGGGAGAQVKLG